MCFEILFEDNHLLVLNKPAGTLVHGDKTGDPSLVDWSKRYLKEKYSKPGNVFIGSCHRLDRPVSGVLLLARTSKALRRMNDQFRDQEVKKTYWAISDSMASATTGIVEHHLWKNSRRNEVQVVRPDKRGAKLAISQYILLAEQQGRYLWQLQPKTGRSHQLRVAMKVLSVPILGDVKYGGTRINDARRVLLHCRELIFQHPVRKEPCQIVAPLPNNEIWQLFADVQP